MSASIARIYVNNIEVGSIPASTYRDIDKRVRQSKRLYLAWVLAYSGLILRKLAVFFGAMPAMLIGALILLLALSPETFTDFVGELMAAEPAAITQRLRNAVGAIATLAVFVFPFSALIRPRSWLVDNPFKVETSRRIRQLLEVPSEGDMKIEFAESPKQE